MSVNTKISPTLAINLASRKKKAAGEEVYFFGFGESPFPVPEIVTEALRQNAHQKSYLDSAGLPALRQAISDHYNRQYSTTYTENNILIGPGSKELIFRAQLALQRPLILPNPSWVSYAPQAKLLGLDLHWIDTQFDNNWEMHAEDLDAYSSKNKLRNALIILNSPNNPTGCSLSKESATAIAEVARKYNHIIISDEIYSKLSYHSEHCSIAQAYPEGTIISSGLSKWCGAGGWRLGHCILPDQLSDLRDQMISIASETFSCVAAPIQYASIMAYKESTTITTYIQRQNKILSTIASYVCDELKKANVAVKVSQGGFYCFPDFTTQLARRFQDSVVLTNTLLDETGVAMLPGTVFGRPKHELTTRLAFVDFNGQDLLYRYESLDFNDTSVFISNECPQILDGINKLLTWIN